ncbi:MAG: ComEC/Rec2 family competence protein [Patescibacteria group bacterium]|nr:ComEC/Rec2 family competence protein [Patescibacteria group bacterium]
MSSSKIFLVCCLFFIGSIFLAWLSNFSQYVWLIFLISGTISIILFWIFARHSLKKKSIIIILCALFLFAGLWRYRIAEINISNSSLEKFNDTDKKITLIACVNKEPEIRRGNTKLVVKPEKIENIIPSKGNILLTVARYPEYQYGDRLEITGKLKTPPKFDDFNYKDYLAKEGIYSISYYPKIHLIDRGNGIFILSKIFLFKNKLSQSIKRNLSPPQSSILEAIILGSKREISEDQKNKLNIAGIRHITCVSGMHIAILTGILMSLFMVLGFWRQQAFYFSLALILLFVIMTGLQSSAIRAGIMGGMLLLGQYLGKESNSLRILVFAAALMLAINPLLLMSDIGFQLSFLAVFGIICFSQYFRKLLDFIFKRKFLDIKSVLAMTFSAQIFTMPILIYNFGYVSSIAPLTNLLVVPLLPFVIIFGFIFSLIGLIFPFLGWVMSFPSWILLTYITKIVDYFSQIPFALINIKISWLLLIPCYLILVCLAWRLEKAQKLKFLNY